MPVALPPWDEERAWKIAKAVANRKLHMFSAWKGEIDLDDLTSVAFAAIWRAHANFDPEHVTPSGKRVRYVTFAYGVAARRIIDLWRSRGLRAVGMEAFNRNAPIAIEADDRDGTDLEGLSLADWLGQVYVRALRAYQPVVAKRGRKWFSVPQAVAAVMLMRRLKLGCRATADLLADRPDLRTALRMTRQPSYVWFFRAKQLVQSTERPRSRASRPKFVTPVS
jgi:hypothetical protein